MKEKTSEISLLTTFTKYRERLYSEWREFTQKFIVNEKADFIFNISLFLSFTIIGLIIYNAVFMAHFFLFDDLVYIVDNTCIRGISLHNIACAFTRTFTGKWAPLHIMAYMFLYQFFGLNAPIFHLANAFLFIINSFLVYEIVYKIAHNKYAGVISGLLYLLAPIQVESIMFTSELKTTLANLFIFSSFLSYIFYRETGKRVQLILSIFLWVMGLMSKGTAFTLPVMFFLYDFLFYTKKFKRFYKCYILLITIGAGFALSYLIFLHNIHSNIPFLHHLQMAIINTAGLFSYPLYQIILFNMKFVYLSLPYQSWLSVHVVLSIIFLFIIVFIVWRYHKRLPYISFFLLWYGINFIPGSGIENVPAPLLGTVTQGYDHYLPLPYFGIAALFGIILWSFYKQLVGAPYKMIYWTCLVLIFISMGIVTVKKSHNLINSIEVFKSLTEEYPKNPHPLAMLIDEYLLHNETENAQFYLNEMNKRFPSDPFTYYYNGIFLVLENKGKDAKKMFDNAKQGFYRYRISDHLAALNFFITAYNPPYTRLYIDRLKLLKKEQYNPQTLFINLLCKKTFPGIIAQMYTLEQLQYIPISSLIPLSNIIYGCKYIEMGNKQYACAEFHQALFILRTYPFFIVRPELYHYNTTSFAYDTLLESIEDNYCNVR
jgi:tetratricopeptide (TPR) repeat protein